MVKKKKQQKNILRPLSPRGEGGKALMAWPLREELFLWLSLVRNKKGNICAKTPFMHELGTIGNNRNKKQVRKKKKITRKVIDMY